MRALAMRLIVVRAIPFTPTRQRRRQRRPDSLDVIKHRAESAEQSAERPMSDRHHEPAHMSLGQAAHVPLAPLAPSFSSPQGPSAETSACRQQSIFNHPDASHGRLVDACTDWVLQRVDELVALDQGPPLVVPLTVTFSLGSIRPDQVLGEYERFYARLCSLLMCNHERPSKRHLLPFALAFRDDPSTRPGKHRDRPSAHAVFSCHPTVAPHVHSLVVVHPRLVDRFLGIVGTLETVWRGIALRTADPTSAHDAPRYVNRSLHADVGLALGIRELMTADLVGSGPLVRARIRRVVDYCAKLGRRRRDVDDVDLFTVLPTAS
jgi:hypothetical protein